MKKVYVVSWDYDGGGGFDWYTNLKWAKKALREEKANAEAYKNLNWKAHFETMHVKSRCWLDITNEVEGRLYS